MYPYLKQFLSWYAVQNVQVKKYTFWLRHELCVIKALLIDYTPSNKNPFGAYYCN
uniref:AlNc14C189G8399 protein n=1 Tax=Albugo laibachii Nc14 TaxID=890382 RepID=F0WPQ7_9STRA|nr:AlNc14C189G8399 [Albugo laibachii Nc14]CCA24356.1 AlNc14C235G9374 [Albugo laibachii Nc14]|eukprot:CCA24356.1 AlNc14C235G9374 [Albugo laibachii Nc14]